MGSDSASWSVQDLSEGWTSIKFERILAEPLRNGIYKKKEFHGQGVKIVNMGELFAYDFISNQEMKRVTLNARELKEYLVQDGDLLFARRSLVLEGSGKCSLVVHPAEETTFESSIIRVRLRQEEACPRFYYYLFRSPLGSALMASIPTRTAVSGIRGSDLMQLKVPYSPLPIQRKIAAILSAYDDLMENNLRRIRILEEMARIIYREWFVNFRFPRHEKVQIADSPLGEIPKGWEVKTLSDLGTIITLGIVSITSTPSQTNQQINSIVLNNLSDREFLYFSLLELKETIKKYGATGATMLNLSKGKFETLKVVYPEENLIESFHYNISPLFDLIKTLQMQNLLPIYDNYSVKIIVMFLHSSRSSTPKSMRNIQYCPRVQISLSLLTRRTAHSTTNLL